MKEKFEEEKELLACDTDIAKELFWKELAVIVNDGASEDKNEPN